MNCSCTLKSTIINLLLYDFENSILTKFLKNNVAGVSVMCNMHCVASTACAVFI